MKECRVLRYTSDSWDGRGEDAPLQLVTGFGEHRDECTGLVGFDRRLEDIPELQEELSGLLEEGWIISHFGVGPDSALFFVLTRDDGSDDRRQTQTQESSESPMGTEWTYHLQREM
jgi:hypothetical protein